MFEPKWHIHFKIIFLIYLFLYYTEAGRKLPLALQKHITITFLPFSDEVTAASVLDPFSAKIKVGLSMMDMCSGLLIS